MNARFKYTLLISSLPNQPLDLFTCKILPISRIQLDHRLALMDAEDLADLNRIEALLHWSKMHEWDDANIVKTGHQEIANIRSPFLRDLVLWRLEVRTLLTALRRRQQGAAQPAPQAFYGFGQRLDLIRRHWHKADFGMGQTYPWLKQAQQLMADNNPLELDKFMLNLNWQHYVRLGNGHYFDFPAVVLYVLRWYLINRWVSYDAEAALSRFNELISAGMADVSLESEGKS